MIDFVRYVGANDYSPLRFSGWLASALLMGAEVYESLCEKSDKLTQIKQIRILNDL
jgi:hypothetical protein